MKELSEEFLREQVKYYSKARCPVGLRYYKEELDRRVDLRNKAIKLLKN